MTVEKETQLEAWLEENMPDPGGGNPNYVETITGTVANPWGEYVFSELKTMMMIDAVTVYIVDDLLPSERIYLEPSADGISGFTGSCHISPQSNLVIVDREIEYIGYNNSGECVALLTITGTLSQYGMTVEDYTAESAEASCTLTIIHHPLPEN